MVMKFMTRSALRVKYWTTLTRCLTLGRRTPPDRYKPRDLRCSTINWTQKTIWIVMIKPMLFWSNYNSRALALARVMSWCGRTQRGRKTNLIIWAHCRRCCRNQSSLSRSRQAQACYSSPQTQRRARSVATRRRKFRGRQKNQEMISFSTRQTTMIKRPILKSWHRSWLEHKYHLKILFYRPS